MSIRRWAERGTLLVVSAALTGCAVTYHQPPTAPRVRLESRVPFVLHTTETGTSATGSCELVALTGTVRVLRGDTVWFASIHDAQVPRGAPECARGHVGFVALRAHPELHAPVTELRPSRSLVLALVTLPVVMIASVLVALDGW